MTFLERIKRDLRDPRLNRGNNGEIARADRRSLDELIFHFERLDSTERAMHKTRDPQENLYHAICAAYYSHGKDVEKTLITVMKTIGDLAEEKRRNTIGRIE